MARRSGSVAYSAPAIRRSQKAASARNCARSPLSHHLQKHSHEMATLAARSIIRAKALAANLATTRIHNDILQLEILNIIVTNDVFEYKIFIENMLFGTVYNSRYSDDK